jgi:hypothetical protein
MIQVHPEKPVFELDADQWETFLHLAAEEAIPRPLHIWMKPRVVQFRLPEHALLVAKEIAPVQLEAITLAFSADRIRVRRSRPWSAADKAALRQLVEEGASSFDTAKVLERSVKATRMRARSLGLRFHWKRRRV